MGEKQIKSYNRYAEYRDKKQLTDYAVAQAVGEFSGTFSNWKAGRYMPKVDKLIKIAAAVDAPLEVFLVEE